MVLGRVPFRVGGDKASITMNTWFGNGTPTGRRVDARRVVSVDWHSTELML